MSRSCSSQGLGWAGKGMHRSGLSLQVCPWKKPCATLRKSLSWQWSSTSMDQKSSPQSPLWLLRELAKSYYPVPSSQATPNTPIFTSHSPHHHLQLEWRFSNCGWQPLWKQTILSQELLRPSEDTDIYITTHNSRKITVRRWQQK